MKMYISYEQPFNGRSFTSSQMKEVYRDTVNKDDFQTFDIWIYDMIKSGVFHVITKSLSCFETERRMLQLLNDLNVVSHNTLAVEQFITSLMYRTCLLESDALKLMIEFIYHGTLSLNKYHL